MTRRSQSSGLGKRYALRRKLYYGRHLMKSPSASATQCDPTDLSEANKSFEQEIAQLNETVLRHRADFDNFRKRTQREKEQIRETATETIVSKLLPVIDNMDRAIASAETAADVKSVRDGVTMISTQLKRTLEAEGLHHVDALHQPFDPTQHEALATEHRTDVADNHICEVLLPGYIFKEKLVRAAMVKVAKAPVEEEAASIE